jgi:hypothetical protein
LPGTQRGDAWLTIIRSYRMTDAGNAQGAVGQRNGVHAAARGDQPGPARASMHYTDRGNARRSRRRFRPGGDLRQPGRDQRHAPITPTVLTGSSTAKACRMSSLKPARRGRRREADCPTPQRSHEHRVFQTQSNKEAHRHRSKDVLRDIAFFDDSTTTGDSWRHEWFLASRPLSSKKTQLASM